MICFAMLKEPDQKSDGERDTDQDQDSLKKVSREQDAGNGEQFAFAGRYGDAEASCEKWLCKVHEFCAVRRDRQRPERGVVGAIGDPFDEGGRVRLSKKW